MLGNTSLKTSYNNHTPFIINKKKCPSATVPQIYHSKVITVSITVSQYHYIITSSSTKGLMMLLLLMLLLLEAVAVAIAVAELLQRETSAPGSTALDPQQQRLV